mmetsp:Transcript_17218/g.65707  ORF Transcript_17218/g.65707 Transcript_17218/m.65707 type:complete len:155 (-) Transcript_17218:399-863(-)|eukprot:scaffold870_cov268-Pinguiococcus_pyrenoidosus.AAC.72
MGRAKGRAPSRASRPAKPAARASSKPRAAPAKPRVIRAGSRKKAAVLKKAQSAKPNHNKHTVVQNVGGTSSERYRVPSLRAKYHEAGGCKSSSCQALGCCKKASATAHVRLSDKRRSNNWKLVSFCAEHNHCSKKGDIALRKNAKVVDLTSVNH